MKSTDLSLEGEETSTTAAVEEPSSAVQEPTPLPQAEVVVPGAEATPPEATVVEGMYTSVMLLALSSSRSPWVLTSHVL
jgi:hypothetical protein